MKLRICIFALLFAAFFAGIYLRTKAHSPCCLADHPNFLKFCHEAAHNDRVFNKFKRHPLYSVFRETFSFDEGLEILRRLEVESSDLLKNDLLERVRAIDCYGGPYVYNYEPYGPFSAEALFHLKVAADVKQIVKEQKPLKVIEIGGGCGVLCKILHEVLSIEHYTMVQLEEEQELSQVHLKRLGLPQVVSVTPKELRSCSCDLLISTYAFTECSAKQQMAFVKKLLPGAKMGYFLCNFLPKHYGIRAMKKELVLKKIREIHPHLMILPEVPRTGIKNCKLVWKHEV